MRADLSGDHQHAGGIDGFCDDAVVSAADMHNPVPGKHHDARIDQAMLAPVERHNGAAGDRDCARCVHAASVAGRVMRSALRRSNSTRTISPVEAKTSTTAAAAIVGLIDSLTPLEDLARQGAQPRTREEQRDHQLVE